MVINFNCPLQGLWDDNCTETILEYQVQRIIFELRCLMNFFLMLYLSLRLITQLKSIALHLLYLLPSECVHVDSDGILPTELAQAANLYKEDLPHCAMLSTEYSMWIVK